MPTKAEWTELLFSLPVFLVVGIGLAHIGTYAVEWLGIATSYIVHPVLGG